MSLVPAEVERNTNIAMEKMSNLNFAIAPFVIFLIIGITTFAQNPEQKEEGRVNIINDVRLDTLLQRYTAINERKASIQGFRIQIVASSNRTEIYKVKSQFYSMFPDQRPYVVYQQPNFKLRVGNYRTRLEAYKDLQEILTEFSDAFIIRDELKIEEL